MTIHDSQTGTRAYPTERAHREQWRALARDIAATADSISDNPDEITPTLTPGILEILGSGIEAVGFTSADEVRIREADHVFYCVADPATKVWIKQQRPDAYDLYVLYDDAKPRYVTYMQMAEAMLHYVRLGRKVAAIFYGHPGIFVLSTHRAIKIARREGHEAVMRPGISALDVLCADLGVDPSQPGMQMYEATDMLIRNRVPDTGLHLVLWQVGLIGELGYRRQGYINSNFAVLLDYLEDLYGADHEVVNYVGSRYPGLDPQIDRYTIAKLRDPVAQKWVTGISTFYLPPKTPAQSDHAMLERLGLIQPGQPVKETVEPLRVIDKYSLRERKAFTDFARFDVPRSYQWQEQTGAADFILSLRDDGALRDLYRRDPEAALKRSNAALSARARTLLMQQDPGAMQVAAKESGNDHRPENKRFLTYLFDRKAETAALRKTAAAAPKGQLYGALSDWARTRGYNAEWTKLASDFDQWLHQTLAPWSGVYTVAGQDISLIIHAKGSGASDRVVMNGQRLTGVAYRKGVLTWPAEAGNAHSGYLQTDLTPGGQRRLVGVIWAADTQPGTADKIVARQQIGRGRFVDASLAGSYAWTAADGIPQNATITPRFDPAQGAVMQTQLNGVAVDGPPVVDGRTIHILDHAIPLTARHGAHTTLPTFLQGTFALRLIQPGGAQILRAQVGPDTLAFADHDIADIKVDGLSMRWAGGPRRLTSGTLHFVLDPITLCPMLYGAAQTELGKTVHLRGIVIPDADQHAALAAAPRLGLPDQAWAHVLQMQMEAAPKGGLFLWQGWDKAVTNVARLNALLNRLNQE